jgi:1,2-dihydroxy-3-keto-5-methylthiopentene dioxygenase
MSSLFVYHQTIPDQPYKVLSHLEDIASTLAEHGVGFERLQAVGPVSADASEQELLDTYRVQIDTLMTERGYAVLDVVRTHAADPVLREGTLDEHQCSEDEMRFFIAGRGLFTLHIDEFVYSVLCEKNDLISVPAGTRRWFDIGENPHVAALRFFKHSPAEVVFTGDGIAARFAQLDDL